MNFREIYYEQKEVEVLLIQPNIMKKRNSETLVDKYFKNNNSEYLIADSVTEYNWGLLYIGKYLLENNHSVQVLDFNYYDYCKRSKFNSEITIEDIESILKNKKAKYIGISCMTVGMKQSLEIAKICKLLFPEAIICLGGIHVNYYWNEILNLYDFVDVVILGEGEIVFNQLVESDKNSWKEIHGIAYSKDGYIYQNPPIKYNVNEFSRPAYELVPNDMVLVPRIYLSRGCVGTCKYCSVSTFYSNECRYRNVEQVIQELKYVINHHNVKAYMMGDLSFGQNKKVTMDLCAAIISNGLNHIYWWCQMRICDIDEELLDIMYEAGCRQIGIGIEADEKEVLDNVSANKKNKSVKEICEIILKRNIQVQGYFIIGLPSDTSNTILNNIAQIENLLKNGLITFPHISITIPYPGTALYEEAESFGIEIVEKDFSKYFMNCDAENCGLPVFNSIELSRYQIYALWQLALATAIKYVKIPSVKYINQKDFQYNPVKIKV